MTPLLSHNITIQPTCRWMSWCFKNRHAIANSWHMWKMAFLGFHKYFSTFISRSPFPVPASHDRICLGRIVLRRIRTMERILLVILLIPIDGDYDNLIVS